MMMKIIPVTVVHAKCCTDCVLEDLEVAARTKKEKEVLARFRLADNKFFNAKYQFGLAICSLRENYETLFAGEDLCDIHVLINELDGFFHTLPEDICTPF